MFEIILNFVVFASLLSIRLLYFGVKGALNRVFKSPMFFFSLLKLMVLTLPLGLASVVGKMSVSSIATAFL